MWAQKMWGSDNMDAGIMVPNVGCLDVQQM